MKAAYNKACQRSRCARSPGDAPTSMDDAAVPDRYEPCTVNDPINGSRLEPPALYRLEPPFGKTFTAGYVPAASSTRPSIPVRSSAGLGN